MTARIVHRTVVVADLDFGATGAPDPSSAPMSSQVLPAGGGTILV